MTTKCSVVPGLDPGAQSWKKGEIQIKSTL